MPDEDTGEDRSGEEPSSPAPMEGAEEFVVLDDPAAMAESARALKEGLEPSRKPTRPLPRKAKPNPWAGVFRFALIAAVAVLTALIGARVNPPAPHLTNPSLEPELEPILFAQLRTVEIDTTSLQNAVDSLNTVSPIRIEVELGSGVSKTSASAKWDKGRPPPRPIVLKTPTLGKALAVVLATFDGSGRDLSYAVDAGRIRVGSADVVLAKQPMIIRFYEVDDLLEEMKRDPPPPQGKGLFGGAGIFGGSGSTGPPTDSDRLDSLIRLVQENVAPTMWAVNGGTQGGIAAQSGKLLITAVPELHREVQRLLFMLRHGELSAREPARATSTSSTTTTSPARAANSVGPNQGSASK